MSSLLMASHLEKGAKIATMFRRDWAKILARGVFCSFSNESSTLARMVLTYVLTSELLGLPFWSREVDR